mgnify:CR=1 FL=1
MFVFALLQNPAAAEASIRNLPPSALGDASNFDASSFLEINRGKPLPAIVEQVRDGSTVRVYLLPEFQYVQVFIAGIQVSPIYTLISLIFYTMSYLISSLD